MFKKMVIVASCLLCVFSAYGMKKIDTQSYALKYEYTVKGDDGKETTVTEIIPLSRKAVRYSRKWEGILNDEEPVGVKEEQVTEKGIRTILNITPFLMSITDKLGGEMVASLVRSLASIVQSDNVFAQAHAEGGKVESVLPTILVADALDMTNDLVEIKDKDGEAYQVSILDVLCFDLFSWLGGRSYKDILFGVGEFLRMYDLLPPALLDHFFTMPLNKRLRDEKQRAALLDADEKLRVEQVLSKDKKTSLVRIYNSKTSAAIREISGKLLAQRPPLLALEIAPNDILVWDYEKGSKVQQLRLEPNEHVVQVFANGAVAIENNNNHEVRVFLSTGSIKINKTLQGWFAGGFNGTLVLRQRHNSFALYRDSVDEPVMSINAEAFGWGEGCFALFTVERLLRSSSDLFLVDQLTFLQRVVMNALLWFGEETSIFKDVKNGDNKMQFLEVDAILDAFITLPKNCIGMLVKRYSQDFVFRAIETKLRKLELELMNTDTIATPESFMLLGGLFTVLHLTKENELVRRCDALQRIFEKKKQKARDAAKKE